MDQIKTIKLQLIQHILSCEDEQTLRLALQLFETLSADKAPLSNTEQALHQALLGASVHSPDPSTSAAQWTDEAVLELQRSIDEIFG